MDRNHEIIELRRRDEAVLAARVAGEAAARVTASLLVGAAGLGVRGLVAAYEEAEHRTWRIRHQAKVGATFTLSYLKNLPRAVVDARSRKSK